MTARVLILVAAMLATPAQAECGNIVMPPAQYAHPFPGRVVRAEVSWSDIGRTCAALDLGDRQPACAIRIQFRCFEYLPKVGTGGISDAEHACYDAHEQAHCNGWRWDHPGGRYR